MPAAQTQMNVRINADVKREGDSILADLGFSPSSAVRALWDYVVSHRNVPPFMRGSVGAGAASAAGHAQRSDGEVHTFSSLAEEGAGMAARIASQAGLNLQLLQDCSYDDLKDYAFDEYCRNRGWDDLAQDVPHV